MTKAQLLKKLEPFDDNMEVWVRGLEDDEFTHQPIGDPKVTNLDMRDSNGDILANVDVIEIREA